MTDQTYPPVIPAARPDPRIFSATDQAFLVGETLFLRGLEDEDAVRAGAWRDSPYPINAERAGEIVRELTESDKPGHRFLVACRRSDGQPVGSVAIDRYGGNELGSELTLHTDPARTDGDCISAEMLALIVAWGLGEGELPLIQVSAADDQTDLHDMARSIGMRPTFVHRESRWRDSRWQGWTGYAIHHPAWLRRLGDPGTGLDHAVPADDPIRWRPWRFPVLGTVMGDPPVNAVLIGPRVYLRPMEIADATAHTLNRRRDPDLMFVEEGREPGSSAASRHGIRRMARPDPPAYIQLAICHRETGAFMGYNGLYGIDRINRTAETGTFLGSDWRNSGYGSEAKQLMLRYAFEQLGLHSVYSWVWGPNTRSAAALRKQGYREAGRVFWAGTKGGVYTHAFAFDFLADEWRQMAARDGNGRPAGADDSLTSNREDDPQ